MDSTASYTLAEPGGAVRPARRRPRHQEQQMPDHLPTVTQFASPDLIHAIVYGGRDQGDDPRWPESGAPDADTYRRWCGHMCGIACLRMALLARTGTAPTLFELLDGARRYGAYTEDEDTGTIRGMIYAPAAVYAATELGLQADVHPELSMPDLLDLLDAGRLVMASVHKEIRRPDRPAPGKGGHLVLVTHRQGDTLHFRNPSGDSDRTRTARLHTATFAGFFAGRGMSLD
ncbi:C39 family peptidase [Streptomyces tanashiensis]|uniref:C39 family peptidase n=1 Tax=Streptomyces tanashiensis TaxID=67367 RepID=UPI002B3FFE37|nr:C39 family peptidase [Streptomyces tanashiensis]